jgi:predicted esterase
LAKSSGSSVTRAPHHSNGKLNITPHNIITSKTARYYTAGKIDDSVRELWFVLHGYGQLAGEFINEFPYLASEGSAVVAPEALSRFYNRSKPGASWMTKEDRENEIHDYVTYLDSVAEELSTHLRSACRFNLLGFSQGVHTAMRWFCKGKPEFTRILMCSSDVPKDTDYTALLRRSKNSALYYICGSKDEFVSPETYEAGKAVLDENGVSYKAVPFEGNHRVNHELIRSLAASGS